MNQISVVFECFLALEDVGILRVMPFRGWDFRRDDKMATSSTKRPMRQEGQAALRESEARFRAFANEAPAILWIADPDGSCSFVSRGWQDYTGQSEEAALSFGWLESVHPEDRDETKRIILEATRKREAFSLDYRLRRADGEFRWVLSSAKPCSSPEGAFRGLTGLVIDIHESKQVVQASALLSAIVDSSDDAIIGKDLNGIIMSWNKSAERLFGYTAAEAVGQSVVMLIPAERLDEEPQILERLKSGERVEHFETIRVRKDGTRLNISLTISPIKDADGELLALQKSHAILPNACGTRKPCERRTPRSNAPMPIYSNSPTQLRTISRNRFEW